MSSRNMTDIIEAYLKKFLKHQEHVEIKRSDIAEHFDCVPSQINYVIKTRFTQEQNQVDDGIIAQRELFRFDGLVAAGNKQIFSSDRTIEEYNKEIWKLK